MPKTKGITTTVNMRLPSQLLIEIEDLLKSGKTMYADRTDFIKAAAIKELNYQKALIKGQQLHGAIEQPQEVPSP